MHEIIWSSADGAATTWGIEDGLFTLPPQVAAALGARAVVAAAGHALLLTELETVVLQAGVAAVLPGSSGADRLVWLPDRAAKKPARLGPESTRGDEDGGMPPELHLVCANGEVLELAERPLLVGRHPACDLHLEDDRASAVHCLLQLTPRGVRLVDMKSRNGTFVDGVRVSEALLRRRAVVTVGGLRLRLHPVGRPGRVELPSAQMARLHELVARVAPSDAPVLVHGESGAGKDGIAQLVHASSGRPGRYVPINAAAVSPTLAGSELFGHVRGAFTGAESDHEGAFQAADGGTLFLDEVAELPLATQAELLRALEQKRVRRVGDTREMPVDVRLVTATHRDLASCVREGRFREDLFHRICVIPLLVPPLRERPDDLEALARHFLAEQPRPRRLSAPALAKLRRHVWPGNIRELINVLRRACIMSDTDVLQASDLRLAPTSAPPGRLDELILDTVLQIHTANGGNVTETARQLGVHRATIYRHLRAARGSLVRAGRRSA